MTSAVELYLLATKSVQPPVWALTDSSTNTNANSTSARTLTAVWPVNAYDAQPGTVYQIEMPFQVQNWGGQTLQLGLSLDGATSFLAGVTIGAAVIGAGAGLLGNLRVLMQIITTGTGGTFNAFLAGTMGLAANNSLFTTSGSLWGQSLSQPIDTTAGHNIRINSVFGGSTAGQVVNGYGSTFSRWGR